MTSKQNDLTFPKLPDSRGLEAAPRVDPDLDLKWSAHAVQLMIDDARRRGETPVVLCLGRSQAAALKAHLSALFDGSVVTSLKNQVYAGLKIVELNTDTHLRLETLRSLYDNSRHAEQERIRKAMKERRHGGDSFPPLA